MEDLAEKVHNLGSDQLAVALTAAANAPVATNSILGNLTGQYRAKIPCTKRGKWYFAWEISDADGTGAESGDYDVEAL